MPAVIKIEIISTSADKGLKETVKGLDGLDKAARSAGDGFTVAKGLAVNALSAIASGAAQAAGEMAGFIKDAIGSAGDFEAGMNSFAAASGAGEAELEAFKDQFLALGKELPVSTAEVQQAAIALVKGGLEPAVVAGGALRDSLLFAAAAGMGLEEAADLTTKMLGTFTSVTASAEEQIAFMAQSQELMTKAANASTLDVAKLGDAMLQAAGAAKAGGVSYQDFVTTMGMISPAFGSASEAGTSYKNLLARLIPQTANATGWMKKLGLYTEETGSVFYDSQGQFIGMREAAEKLKVAFEGSSDAVRNEALAMIFGNDAKGAAMALIDGGAAAYDKFAEKMLNANGIQEQATATQKGFNFQMENLGGSIEALQITLGTTFLPMLTEVIGQFTAGVNAVMSFADTFLKLAPAIAASDDPIRTFFNILRISTDDSLNPMINKVQEVVGAIQSFGATLQANATPIIAGFAGVIVAVAVPAFTAWAVAAAASATATIAALAPVLIPIAAIGVAAALLGLAWQQNWGDIQGKTAAAWAVLQPILTELWTWLGTTIPPIIAQLSGFFTTTLLPAMTSIANYIITNLIAAFTSISEFITGTVVPALSALWAFITNDLIPIFEDLWTIQTNLLTKAFTPLATFITGTVVPAFSSLASFLSETVQKAIKDLSPTIESANGALSGFSGAFDSIAKAVGGAIGQLKDFLDWAAKASGASTPSGGGGGGGAPGKALGGPVMAGEAYMVGERGPELFVPQRAGSVVDANRTAGQKYVTNNYNYSPTYSSTPASPSADFSLMKALAGAGT